MDRSDGIRRLMPVLCTLLLGATGCAELDSAMSGALWPWGGKTSDVVAGVPSPAERLAVLRKLAQKAASATPGERERISGELAVAYREEADPLIRVEIVRALGSCPTATSASVLGTALHDSDADVRASVCEALGRQGGPDAAAMLSEALASDIDPDVRLAAARALGETGEVSAVAALGEVLGDRDPAMQYRAVRSLAKLTGKDFGNDVGRWRQYVRGETPSPPRPVSIAERVRRLF